MVDYTNIETLQFALRGIDTVISTVTGVNQIELIKAAVSARVRRFAPAEFEGLPQLRSSTGPLDRGRTLARQWLSYYAQHIQSTTFVCGILYERFQPGGLQHSRMGVTSGFGGEGDYIMDCRNMDAQVPAYDKDNNPNVTICMTAAQDVGRFVTKAVDMRQWPAEMRMCGQRVPVRELVASVQQLKGKLIFITIVCILSYANVFFKGQQFNPIQWHNPDSLRSELQLATAQQDQTRAIRLHTLIATAEGKYDFADANLNRAFRDIRPISFKDWFVAKWNLQQ